MRITKEMTIFETIRAHPRAMEVLRSHDMSCGGCMAVMDESLEKGARRHGANLAQLLSDLNSLFDTTREGGI